MWGLPLQSPCPRGMLLATRRGSDQNESDRVLEHRLVHVLRRLYFQYKEISNQLLTTLRFPFQPVPEHYNCSIAPLFRQG